MKTSMISDRSNVLLMEVLWVQKKTQILAADFAANECC